MTKIPDRQQQIDSLAREYFGDPQRGSNDNGHRVATPDRSDEEVLALCRKAKNAAKFSDLYDAGDTTAYGGDESRADQALASMLAFYTQQADQIERLQGGSALGQRPKWKDRFDYRRRTVDFALRNIGETYTPRREAARSGSRSLGSTGMRNDGNGNLNRSIQAQSFSGLAPPGPRGWIVDNTVWEGHATSRFGEGGVAKSLLALHLALTVAAEGRSYWIGFAVKTVPVLYLDFELDTDEQHRRALDLTAGMGLTGIPENFYYLSVAMLPPGDAFGIAAEECRRLGVGLVIVDSVGFALDGDSESARDVLGFYRTCVQPLKDAGASPLLIDHQAKIIKGEKYSDKQAFGSVYKTNAVRSSFQIRGSHEQGEITATFTHKKNNFGWKEKDFSLKIAFEEGRTTVERLEAAIPNPDREPSKKDLVLAAVEGLGRATTETVSRKTGIDLKTVQNAFSELLRAGALGDTGEKHGSYRIVIPHSQSTKGPGTGTGTTDEGGLFQDDGEHGDTCMCEECLPV